VRRGFVAPRGLPKEIAAQHETATPTAAFMVHGFRRRITA